MGHRREQMEVLRDQAAIVTGAGTGIGAATAVRFAREGASVVLVGRREAKLHETARAIGDASRVAIAPGDVAQAATAESAVRTCLDRFGRLDVVVNYAAYFSPTPFLSCDLTDW